MPRQKKLPDGLKERNGAYYADFYGGNRRVRKRLSRDLATAKTLLIELRSRAERADFGLLDDDYPLDQLRKEFLRDCRQTLKPASVYRYEVCLANIVQGLAVNRVAQITLEVIRHYRERRLKADASPRTINMEVTVLGTMLRWGVREQKIGSNPLTDIKHLPHPHQKEGRALSDEEVSRLLEKSEQPWRDIWYTFLATGMRKDELATLVFADIDWEQNEIHIRRGISKNHRARRIPVNREVGEILRKQEAGRDSRQPGKAQRKDLTRKVEQAFSRDHVFVSTANTPLTHRSRLYHAFMRDCRRVDIQTRYCNSEGRVIEHVDLHSLRRTFATNLIVNGADPKSVQELLGHQTLRLTMEIYAKVHTQTKRQAIGKLSYGSEALVPEHILEYPDVSGEMVQNGHQMVTEKKSSQMN